MHNYQDLIELFNACFSISYRTVLVRGEEEPLYIPASPNENYHKIYFAHGFYSSALHECAHWFIAGAKRRLLPDYGYWYIPDGRNPQQQAQFQRVEVKPQAIEWILSQAAGFNFNFSIDNLYGETTDTTQFKQAVYQQISRYCKHGLPQRASYFHQTLCSFYNTSPCLAIGQFVNPIN